jgi:hypothetical protein
MAQFGSRLKKNCNASSVLKEAGDVKLSLPKRSSLFDRINEKPLIGFGISLMEECRTKYDARGDINASSRPPCRYLSMVLYDIILFGQ